MILRSIELSAVESHWRLFMVRKSDPAFQRYETRVFVKDHYTCQYCGFVEKQYMEVVNADNDYTNNHLNNLVTACPFCAQCFFLDGIGKSNFGGGTLIYLPEMTQGELNALCHVLFTAIMSGGMHMAQAKAIYRDLKLRAQHVEKSLGEGLSNPSLYGQLLIDTYVENKTQVHHTIASQLRVLPNMTRFVSQIEAWSLSALNDLQ